MTGGYRKVGLIWPAHSRNPTPHDDSWASGELDTIDADGTIVNSFTYRHTQSITDLADTAWSMHTYRWNPNGTVTYEIKRDDVVISTRTWWPPGSFPHLRKPSIRRRARHARYR